MSFLKRFKNRFIFEKGSLNGAGHKFRFKTSLYCYIYPQVTGVYGGYYDHPFPNEEYIDWSKEPYRIQPCQEIMIFWLWFRLYIDIHHHYEWQNIETVRKRNECSKYKKCIVL